MNKDVLDYVKVGVCEYIVLILKECHLCILEMQAHLLPLLTCSICRLWADGQSQGAKQGEVVPGCAVTLTSQRVCVLAADGALAWRNLDYLPSPTLVPWDKRSYISLNTALPHTVAAWGTKTVNTNNKWNILSASLLERISETSIVLCTVGRNLSLFKNTTSYCLLVFHFCAYLPFLKYLSIVSA